MPASRTVVAPPKARQSLKIFQYTPNAKVHDVPVVIVSEGGAVVDLAEQSAQSVAYPEGTSRTAFRTTDGKAVTPHQWAVYDLVRAIPCGRVTTYKDLCAALGEGSPRSVGAALRRNPFAPFVPCHRVIASSGAVGGFFGEWGRGAQCDRKVRMLAQEGVGFTPTGFLVDGQHVLWRAEGAR